MPPCDEWEFISMPLWFQAFFWKQPKVLPGIRAGLRRLKRFWILPMSTCSSCQSTQIISLPELGTSNTVHLGFVEIGLQMEGYGRKKKILILCLITMLWLKHKCPLKVSDVERYVFWQVIGPWGNNTHWWVHWLLSPVGRWSLGRDGSQRVACILVTAPLLSSCFLAVMSRAPFFSTVPLYHPVSSLESAASRLNLVSKNKPLLFKLQMLGILFQRYECN